MSGQLKIPNLIGNKRPIDQVFTAGDLDFTPPIKKAKICEIEEELITGEASQTEEIKSDEVGERDAKQTKKLFAVFVCGPDPTQCIEDPSAPNQRGKTYIDLLKKDDAHEEWKEFMIYRDEFPSASEISSFTAIIITGSKHDAFTDDVEWKLKLQEIILDIYENRPMVKILGVCFGHQIIIQSLRYNKTGYIGRKPSCPMDLGLVSMDLTDAFHKFWARFGIKINAKRLKSHTAHQDFVLKMPPHLKDAGIMAHSQYTEVEMFHIGDNIIGIQGHIEFDTAYLMNAIERNRKYLGKIYSEEKLQSIVANMRGHEADREQWQYMFTKWIRF